MDNVINIKDHPKKQSCKSTTFFFNVNEILDMSVEYVLALKNEDPDKIKEGLHFLIHRIKDDYPNILIKY